MTPLLPNATDWMDLTRHLGEEGKFTKVEPVFIGGEWYAPTKYIKLIPDSVVFNKAIFIDRHNQNITTFERKEKGYWLIRSMNPATNRTTSSHTPRNSIGYVRSGREKDQDDFSERTGLPPPVVLHLTPAVSIMVVIFTEYPPMHRQRARDTVIRWVPSPAHICV